MNMNAVLCCHCKEVIQSTHVHDFKWCGCEERVVDGVDIGTRVAVDGGQDYSKRCYAKRAKFIGLRHDEDLLSATLYPERFIITHYAKLAREAGDMEDEV